METLSGSTQETTCQPWRVYPETPDRPIQDPLRLCLTSVTTRGKSSLCVWDVGYSKHYVIRIQWDLRYNSDYAKIRITRRKMHWFWSIWSENMFGLRGLHCIGEMTGSGTGFRIIPLKRKFKWDRSSPATFFFNRIATIWDHEFDAFEAKSHA